MYTDSAKENGNYNSIIGLYRGHIGIMEEEIGNYYIKIPPLTCYLCTPFSPLQLSKLSGIHSDGRDRVVVRRSIWGVSKNRGPYKKNCILVSKHIGVIRHTGVPIQRIRFFGVYFAAP